MFGAGIKAAVGAVDAGGGSGREGDRWRPRHGLLFAPEPADVEGLRAGASAHEANVAAFAGMVQQLGATLVAAAAAAAEGREAAATAERARAGALRKRAEALEAAADGVEAVAGRQGRSIASVTWLPSPQEIHTSQV